VAHTLVLTYAPVVGDCGLARRGDSAVAAPEPAPRSVKDYAREHTRALRKETSLVGSRRGER